MDEEDDDDEDAELDHEDEASEDEDSQPRTLSEESAESDTLDPFQRRRRRGASAPSPRRRSSPTRRRTSGSSSASSPAPRRRAAPVPRRRGSLRRRGAPPTKYSKTAAAPPGSKSGGQFKSSKNPQAGSYGYSSAKKTKFDKNYGGNGKAPKETKYGYSGKDAYGKKSKNKDKSFKFGAGAGLAVGLGAGLVLGAGATYLAYRYTRYDSGCGCRSMGPCYVDGSGTDGRRYETCRACERAVGRNAKCGVRMEEDLSRDDVMTASFKPVDYNGKVKLTISDVTGTMYTAAKMCPNSTTSNITTWMETNSVTMPLMFVTLTKMDQMEGPQTKTANFASGLSGMDLGTAILTLLALRMSFRR